ncbi:MAG: diguanylate cyclase/phosphodiesterase with sensor(s) [Bryobacterales bacterium]|nr:diguanylate cyclase/phosphodiesterase with sensor(s) [Bryobacterales bacterium]
MERDISQSQHGSPRWKVWAISVVLVGLLGAGVSVVAFKTARSWELQSTREEFRLAAASYGYAVRREIESNLGALRTLRAYVNVTKRLDGPSFSSFAAEAIQANPSIRSLEWVPRIPASGRLQFEREMAERGVTPSYLRSSSAPVPARAPDAPEYYPVRFVHPAAFANRILGYDLRSTVAGREALERAAASRNLVVGPKSQLVETYRDGAGLPSYLAVFDGSAGAERVRGYVLAVFQMGDVLENGLRRLEPEPIEIEFYDLSAVPGKRFLYRHSWSALQAAVKMRSEAEALANADFKQVVRFDVGGREWAMVMTATEVYKSAHRTWQPWGILAFGLCLKGIAVTYFLLHITHARRDAELRQLRSRKTAENALRESEARYALAARGSKDGLWDWDLVTGRVYYSERWKSMLGFENEEIGDSPDEWMGRFYAGERGRVEVELSEHCAGKTDHFQSEYRMLHRDGTYRWMLSRGVAVLNQDGVATRVAGSQTDITENKSADHLTGLASRISLNENLQLAIDHSRDGDAELFAVLFLDLDRFKVVNDSLGHLAGDRLLVEIASRLTDCATSPPFHAARTTIARLGGDEFAVLIRAMSYSGMAIALANAIQETMKPAFDLAGHQVFVSTSIGVRIGDPNATPEILLRDADTAMYHAKSCGKQRYEVFVPAMRFRAVERLRLETDLRNAIENNELVLYYQPKVCLVTGVVAELEALVRWNHPERGLISPSEFIPLADETGLILPLGTWVLREACRQMREWLREFPVDSRLRVSVNLSCKQFKQENFFEQITGVLLQADLAPERLSLEVTEGVLMENMENAVVLLKRLRERGIGLQIDDFGTGYSSLTYLHRLRFDALKIDRDFVREMCFRQENAQIVRTIILLARTLGMSVVAEGVENSAQLQLLIDSGCDYAQGHLFSEAVDGASASRFFGGFSRVLDSLIPTEGVEA